MALHDWNHDGKRTLQTIILNIRFINGLQVITKWKIDGSQEMAEEKIHRHSLLLHYG